nr:lantibiotic mutacin II protein MutM - Streptococcus mutans [Streptococcus mutans]
MNNPLFPEFLSYMKKHDSTVKKSLSFYSENFIDISIFKLIKIYYDDNYDDHVLNLSFY